jgi:lysozyme
MTGLVTARHVNGMTLALIKQWEGLRLDAYRDVGGVWTIGYGHTGDVGAGQRITEAEAGRLLRADLARFEAAVDRLVVVALSDNQFGALVSFAFNVGEGAFARSTLLRRLNAGEHEAVPAELAKWNRAGGRVVAGLANRRAAEAGLWVRGDFVAGKAVEAAPPAGPVAALATPLTIGGAIGAAGPGLAALAGLPWQAVAAIALAAAAIAVAAILGRRGAAA